VISERLFKFQAAAKWSADRFASIVLPNPRADIKNIMSARAGDFQGAFADLLPAHFSKLPIIYFRRI
jgi:hypothetical protein